MTSNASTRDWLVLLVLTAVTFGLAEAGVSGATVLLPVLLATLLKGRIVIDRFMALRDVSAPWRWVVLGWLIVVLGAIGYAFRASLN
ncbi:cytochrome C oxidase subunit IV family protein [Noviherbaspirillum sp.]|uniref:cytochrome C oxidase subunit IV family protein n=1 Tax=Noviherbaspirillum sp. TaxID=1926288 RepID=UPI002D223BB9|nr:cytochrome C oxidase subunit IV family protein [Noviherbaspirillum sp.]HZW21123.1 cytochrome C oxidase subunit IV family protein [Noviherbaspirillum sp.]